MKYQERLKAIKLRKQGKSYLEILQEVRVSKGTLSLWLRDVILTPKQKKRLYVTLRQQNGYRQAKLRQKEKEERKQKILLQSKKEIYKLSKNKFFLCGLMLYWAEGDKTENASVKFSNSDPNMICFMIKWFMLVCKVPKAKFHVCLHIHELHNQKKIEQYWSNLLKIPLKQFYKTQIKPTSLGQRKKLLYNGTCAIQVGDISLFRRIQGWTQALTEDMDKILKIR